MADGIQWDDLIARSKAHGFLAWQLYAIFTTPAGGFEDLEGVLASHLEYQVDLERRGIMFAAGPLSDADGKVWKGRGLIVVRAGSLQEARRLAEADPMHSSGVRQFEIVPWCVNEGGLDLRLNYSNGTFEFKPRRD